MKGWLIAFTIVTATMANVVIAKQENSPNPRVISQEEQLTVGEQSNKPVDIAMTKKIRNELMKDDSLSTKAKNIKIITVNNGVTLKGMVDSADEREKVLEHAYTTATKYKIYNQISVKK